MARLLHLAPPDRHLRGHANHTRHAGNEERIEKRLRASATSLCRELVGGWRLVYAAQEGGQVLRRLAEPLPHDRAADAARSGEAVQGIQQRAREAPATDTLNAVTTLIPQLSQKRVGIVGGDGWIAPLLDAQ